MQDELIRIYHYRSYVYSCPHREAGAVGCDMRADCNRCGWNPAVEERRKAAIREAMKEEDPEGWLRR